VSAVSWISARPKSWLARRAPCANRGIVLRMSPWPKVVLVFLPSASKRMLKLVVVGGEGRPTEFLGGSRAVASCGIEMDHATLDCGADHRDRPVDQAFRGRLLRDRPALAGESAGDAVRAGHQTASDGLSAAFIRQPRLQPATSAARDELHRRKPAMTSPTAPMSRSRLVPMQRQHRRSHRCRSRPARPDLPRPCHPHCRDHDAGGRRPGPPTAHPPRQRNPTAGHAATVPVR
jgi:hypothetical protein